MSSISSSSPADLETFVADKTFDSSSSPLPHFPSFTSSPTCPICVDGLPSMYGFYSGQALWKHNLTEYTKAAENGCTRCKLSMLLAQAAIDLGELDVRMCILKHQRPSLWPADETFRDVSTPREDVYQSVISDWLQQCIGSHSVCATPHSPLPSRVLDVGTSANLSLRLYTSRGETAAYTALSHCWGKGVVITTTLGNFLQRQEGIKFDDLPKTFQDAVTVTRSLGIQYLWIDSLCIIQDHKADWEEESGHMASVYSNAHLVIGADGSSDCHEGFLSATKRAKRSVPIATVPSDDGSNCVVYALARRDHEDIYPDEPLASRAWTLQEHVLASRMVHFTHTELVWECRSHICCECMFLDGPDKGRNSRSHFQHVMTDGFYTGSGDDQHDLSLKKVWNPLVEIQLRRNITNEMDRLPCMSGIALKMQANGAGEYLAGLWKSQLPECLLWEVDWIHSSAWERCTPYRAPTWSWASLRFHASPGKRSRKNEVRIVSLDMLSNWTNIQICITIIDTRCTPSGKDPMGTVSDGFIKLSGLVTRVSQVTNPRPRKTNDWRPIEPRLYVAPLSDSSKYIAVSYDIEFGHSDPSPLHCVLVALNTETVPQGSGEVENALAIGLILQDSAEHPNCFERIGLFQIWKEDLDGDVMDFFADKSETMITIV